MSFCSLIALLFKKSLNIPSFGHPIVGFSIHLLGNILLLESFGYESSCCKCPCAGFCVNLVFISFGKIPGSMLTGLYGKSMFTFIRNCQTGRLGGSVA